MTAYSKTTIFSANPKLTSHKNLHFVVKGIVGLSLLLSVGSTQASTLRDTENNNNIANQSASLYAGNLSTQIDGTLSTSDRRDIYSITDAGTPMGEIYFTWIQQSGSAALLQVFRDVNKNKRLDNSDKRLTTSTTNVAKTIRSGKGMMFLAVATNQKGNSRYTLVAGAPAQLKLIVYNARSFGKFDNGDPGDFYVTTNFLRGQGAKKSRVIQNDDTPSFNHTHVGSASSTIEKFEIDIIDKDSKRFGRNRDDRADINPSSKAQKLTMNYNMVTKEVHTSDGRLLGKSGGTSKTIKVKGDDKNRQVQVEFAIF